MERTMTFNELEDQVIALIHKYHIEKNNEMLSDIEKVFENYLKNNQKETQIWLKFALFEYLYFHDDHKALDLLKIILKYDSNCVNAALIMAYLSFTLSFKYQEYVLNKLYKLKTKDPQLLSMIEYAKALYYSNIEDGPRYERCLLKSIKLYNKHVKNNYRLGVYYSKKGRAKRGKELIEHAIQNVQEVYHYPFNKEHTAISVEDFINEHISGTHITDSIYKLMYETLIKIVENIDKLKKQP